MINLEWLRTFRAVYRAKSLSKAAELLRISQPAVSQHLSNLEAHMGQKLFIRKSKGVLETDDGRLLNTLVAGSIESLQGVENMITKKESKLKDILTLGVSMHLYKTLLCQNHQDLGEYVHIKFGKKQQLVQDVEDGTLQYAIIPETINTFDTISFPITKQHLVLVGTPNINFESLEKLLSNDIDQAESWLTNKKWYAHDSASSYIKVFWLHVFNKKRPAIIPNYIIPHEFEILFQLSRGSGLTIALDTNVAPFVESGTLKVFRGKKIKFRELSLIANKNRTNRATTDDVINLLLSRCARRSN